MSEPEPQNPETAPETATPPTPRAGAETPHASEGSTAAAPEDPGPDAAPLDAPEPPREAGPEDAQEPDPEEAAGAADATVLAASRRHTRRSFLAAGAGAAAGLGFYKWIEHSRRIGDQPELLRDSYRVNAALSLGLFDERALAPTYSARRAQSLRVNGVVGLDRLLDTDSWRLQLVGVADASSRAGYTQDVTAWQYRYKEPMTKPDQDTATMMAPPRPSPPGSGPFGRGRRGTAEAGESASTLYAGTPGLLLTMDAITKLPRHEFVTQFKCIEGWSRYVQWTGYRLADFLEEYPPAKLNGKEPPFVYMETPDGNYYTGYNMVACRHPQSLLVTEMMGRPIPPEHGAPLRLHMPIKYGYKQIKRIGLMRYMFSRPDDYWTKLGYDWYAGI